MSLPEELSEALQELEEESPSTITWNGQDLQCFVSGKTRGATLGDGGWELGDKLVVTIRENLFDETRPLHGHSITHNGTSYRVNEVLTASNCFLRLECVSITRGA